VSTRLVVEDTERSQGQSLGSLEYGPRIEAQVGFPGHKGIAIETVILGGVRYDEQARLQNGLLANGNIQGRFVQRHAHLGLEPLPIVRHEAHQRNRHVADLRSHLYDVIEILFPRRVENLVGPQGLQPILFNPRSLGLDTFVDHIRE